MQNWIKMPIRELRKMKHVTQQEVAEAVHVSYQTVSKWENGVILPGIEHLPVLAMYFDVDVEVLLGMRPLEKTSEPVDFLKEDFWDAQFESIKNWKCFYFNDDYLRFLVKDVWQQNKPVDMLDCACGYGYLADKIFRYLPRGSTYTGFDVSEKYLREARAHFGEENPIIRFKKGNLLDYQDEKKYDLVISQMILSYVPNPEKVVAAMAEWLKTGGMLVSIDISLPVAESGFYIASGGETYRPQIPAPQKVWKHLEERGEMNTDTGAQMAMLFHLCGLREVQVRLSDHVFTYDAGDDEADKEALSKYQDVLEHMEHVRSGYEYYMDRGCTLSEAEAFVEYRTNIFNLLTQPDTFVSRASGLYITWGKR